MATNNILPLPFHHTQPLSISTALQDYITKHHTHQHPDLFAKDLKVLDELRSAAISTTDSNASPASILPLQKYAAQLTWLSGNRVPLDIGAEFVWYTNLADTQKVQTVDNLRFELANITYNLAALYSALATSTNRATPEGLKSAASWFCAAAGVIKYMSSTVVPSMRTHCIPEDMEPLALECMLQLMLAQAQECFWAKAVKDGFKDATIAKLAAKVSDFYAAAADAGRQSDAISARWLHHLRAKQRHFTAAAQYRAACDCLDKGKYGEEVARLQDALSNVSAALKEAGSRVSKSVTADLQGLKFRVESDLKRAQKDNDVIYIQPVPSRSELKALGRADMVSPKCPVEISEPLNHLNSNELGKPLFSNLIPHSVHFAAAVYASRRDSRVESVVDDLEALTARIHVLLQSLNLPGALQALEKPLGIPPGLVSHAEEIRQQDGYERLRRTMADIDKLKASDRLTFQEGILMLQNEHGEDDQARRKYGTDRWSRRTSEDAAPKLYAQASEIETYFDTAAKSDETVRENGRENEEMMKLLNGTDADLERFIPSSLGSNDHSASNEASRLRTVLNSLTQLEGQRKRCIESLRSKAKADDVHADLIAEATRLQREAPMDPIEAAQFESLFDARLVSRYDADLRNLLDAERTSQQALLSKLAEANTAFVTARQQRRSSHQPSQREAALQRLENAYFAYKEIVQNLEVGRKFYNDLAGIVAKFRDDARAFVYNRRTEAAQLESDVLTGDALMRGARDSMMGLRLSGGGGGGQQDQQGQFVEGDEEGEKTIDMISNVGQEKVSTNNSRSSGGGGTVVVNGSHEAISASNTASTKPLAKVSPVAKMWTPEVGIKFAGVTTPSSSSSSSAAGGHQHQQQQQQQQQDGKIEASVGGNGGSNKGMAAAPTAYPNRDKRWDPTQGLRFS